MSDTIVRPPFDPELATFLTALEARGPFTLTAEMLPRMRQLDVPVDVLDERLRSRGYQRRNVTVPGYLGDPIDLAIIDRVERTGAAGATAAVYSIHGGGMVFGHHLGNLDSFDDWLLDHDVVLVSVDYRLAPEYPDPYPVEDCYAGLVWVAAHADSLGIDPSRIVIAGQSAGGGLAVGTALLARDRQGPDLMAEILVAPMLDDRDDTVSTRQIDGVGVADRQMNRFAWDAYLGPRRATADVSEYAAPARAADLSALPKTYIDCGSAEVFRDEDVAFASRLWAAGVDAELHVWPGAFHGFTSMVPDAAISRTATAALADWTRRLLGDPSPIERAAGRQDRSVDGVSR
ncbi:MULTISPECIES: alpha/beta hydrolase [unclassified Curtobacterium]|uniref:alpha/beta hydrolase n=1 Tax=unclassified Curtobacterium TaxID=257496 RepID=UPI000F48678F|nr:MULTISPECIES: alpha/beta hydrolase [unclassified Curtobacterium]ROQ18219.1 acetyl esterase/lipase [Curtobacterium sp. PhB171]ROQ30183.1 acetyl esterase/lipase [Curtobacterium sp. PhB170]ROS32391.1 acetyl esterase/lipase [Curtobacterium sp. PhB131]ROS73492.1 acetyl esterase/lipase [Curtobacterium sp. PhB141]